MTYSNLLPCGQCVDLSCNELTEINLPENLPPKLQELDLTGNPRLNLDHKTLEQLKYAFLFSARFFPYSYNALRHDIYIVVLVHTLCSGVIRSLLRFIRFFLSTIFFCHFSNIRCFRIDPPPTFSSNETSGGPAVWSHGFTEASGVKNK